ncbi:MAG: MaoC family dehydratase [Flavobacteriales bacterium]|nr:MaoC family dehydratase [Flavobacteriales bacterium]
MVFKNIAELKLYEGKHIGKSDWLTITQNQIDDFAKATGDFQWIHVDVERSKMESPFKKTIAHGYLTLSLIAKFVFDLVEITSVKSILNYGTNNVRFTNVVTCDSDVRLDLTLKTIEKTNIGYRTTFSCNLELKDNDKPAVVAELIAFLIE